MTKVITFTVEYSIGDTYLNVMINEWEKQGYRLLSVVPDSCSGGSQYHSVCMIKDSNDNSTNYLDEIITECKDMIKEIDEFYNGHKTIDFHEGFKTATGDIISKIHNIQFRIENEKR